MKKINYTEIFDLTGFEGNKHLLYFIVEDTMVVEQLDSETVYRIYPILN